MAQDEKGEYSIPVIFPAAAHWVEGIKFNTKIKASISEVNVVTKSIQISFIKPGGNWSQLGEIEIIGESKVIPPDTTIVPPPQSIIPKQVKSTFQNPVKDKELEVWIEKPWIDTKGGVAQPKTENLFRNPLIMLQGDTEQVMLCFLNKSKKTLPVTVNFSSNLPQKKSTIDLLYCGAMKTRNHGTQNINLFNSTHIKSFKGNFPKPFTNTEIFQNFPELYLPTNQPVRVWVQIRTFNPQKWDNIVSAGNYQVNISVEKSEYSFNVKLPISVLPIALSRKPPIEVMPYGGIDTLDDKLHYSTINNGFKTYAKTNFRIDRKSNNLLKLEKTNPSQFKQIFKDKIENLQRGAMKVGYRKEQILVEIFDEPCDRNANKWVAYAKAIKSVAPDTKIIANPPADWPSGNMATTLEGSFKKMAPYVDVWMPYSAHYLNDEVRKFLKSTGKPLWFYKNIAIQTCRSELDIVKTYRRFGWLANRFNLDGIGVWSVSFYVSDQWDDFDKSKHYNWPDAALVFKSDAGPIPTRGWESWRETVEDVQIYKIIKHALGTLEISGSLREDMQGWLNYSPIKMTENPQNIYKVKKEALELLMRMEKEMQDK